MATILLAVVPAFFASIAAYSGNPELFNPCEWEDHGQMGKYPDSREWLVKSDGGAPQTLDACKVLCQALPDCTAVDFVDMRVGMSGKSCYEYKGPAPPVSSLRSSFFTETFSYCTRVEPECADKDYRCRRFTSYGFCQSNMFYYYMRDYCRKSCGYCSGVDCTVTAKNSQINKYQEVMPPEHTLSISDRNSIIFKVKKETFASVALTATPADVKQWDTSTLFHYFKNGMLEITFGSHHGEMLITKTPLVHWSKLASYTIPFDKGFLLQPDTFKSYAISWANNMLRVISLDKAEVLVEYRDYPFFNVSNVFVAGMRNRFDRVNDFGEWEFDFCGNVDLSNI